MIAFYSLNPFKSSLDAIISCFDKRRVFLEEVAKHADRFRYLQDQELRTRELEEEKQREKLNRFMKQLDYANCTTKHAQSQDAIHRNLDPGRWLLQRDDFREWSSGGTDTPSGLLWAYGKGTLFRVAISWQMTG